MKSLNTSNVMLTQWTADEFLIRIESRRPDAGDTNSSSLGRVGSPGFTDPTLRTLFLPPVSVEERRP